MKHLILFALLLSAVAAQVPRNVQKTPGTNAITEDLVIPSGRTFTLESALAWADNVRQTLNPGATVEGLNVGSVTSDPSTPINGGLWYNSTSNELRARINGATVALGAGGGGGIAGSTGAADNTLLRSDGTGGATLQASNVTLADSGTAFVFSGAAGLTASGSNQDITLTPSGTGVNILVNGTRIGTASGTALTTGPIQIYGSTDSTASFGMRRGSADAFGPYVGFSKSRGSIASPAAVQNGDQIGAFVGGGYDGSAHSDFRAILKFVATQNWSSGNTGSSVVFGTTPNNSASRADRMTIDHDGQIYLNGTSSTPQQANVGGFTMFGSTDTSTFHMLYRSSADAVSSQTVGMKSRGTNASPTATQSGDLLFSVGGGGYGTTAWRAGIARVGFFATQNLSDTALGSRIVLSTTPNSSQTRADRVIIDQDGSVIFGAAAPAAAFTGSSPRFLIPAESASVVQNISVASGTATNRGIVQGFRSRGTLASPTVVSSGDAVFSVLVGAYDGSAMEQTGEIAAMVDGSVSSGVVPMRWDFSTSATNGSGRATRFSIKNDGKVYVGGEAPAAGFLDSTQRLIHAREAGSHSVALLTASGTSTDRGILQAFKSRGTFASPTTTASGDYIWSLRTGAHDGTNIVQGGEIAVIVDGAVSTGVVPQRMEFHTTTTDSASRASRLTIKSDGAILLPANIATTSTTSGTLQVTGGAGITGNVHIGGALRVATSTPSSASDTGVAGTITWDSSYIYVCVATNTWKRVAISSW